MREKVKGILLKITRVLAIIPLSIFIFLMGASTITIFPLLWIITGKWYNDYVERLGPRLIQFIYEGN